MPLGLSEKFNNLISNDHYKETGDHMKNLLMGLVLVATTTAFAQSSSTQLPTTNTPNGSAPTAATPTQTLTTELNAQPNKFGANLIFEGNMGVSDLKENGSQATMDSVNAVGVTYKVSEMIKTELRHNFQLRSVRDRELLKNERTGEIEDNYKTLDPTIHVNFKTPYSLLGSKPISISNRYYIPVSKDSQDVKSLGTLRNTNIIGWDVNPRWTVEYMAEFRLYLNSTDNPKTEVGSDSRLRMLTGPSVTYNFSDTLNAFYTPYWDLGTYGHQRGDLSRSEERFDLYQDAGVNYTMGVVTLTPYYSTKATKLKGTQSYVGAGSDENSSYNLVVSAAF